ncbi:hypothetical protein J7T55_007926 [Diaporthe amygdali]|uniref:uncharacterized protein n=1 Tax=Phomopsis amygdali TaxID=1214568 RepID=UPI0022FDC07F|nr:uncharacterized protein J7T55_007926 [Diaporthe amygdali]KAJ0114092.1 hypothetical protein J7T55_007926 [Diaporthe amygdali]
MRSVSLILFTYLSSTSAALTSSSSSAPVPSIQLRSVPPSSKPIVSVANNHVSIRKSAKALPKHHALRSILGLDKNHLRRRHNGEPVPTVQLIGQSYIADVTIGDQKIPVLIDTGSADLWVAPSSFVCLDENGNEASRATCNIPVYFNGTFSGEAVEDEYFSITYANGQYVYGSYGYESVTLGGIAVAKQQIALPSTGYFQAASGDFSGIMGLGFPAMTAARNGTKAHETLNNNDPIASYDPWFTNAVKQNLTQPVFSLALDIHGGGLLALGGSADVPTKGDYVSTPILMINLNAEERAKDEFTYYTIIAEDYLIAGQSFANLTSTSNITAGQGFPVIVDSGYSTNILPPSLIRALHSAFKNPPELIEMQGTSLFAAPCDAEVPSFGIQIGGHVFEQTAQEILVASANATVNGTAFCALGSQPGVEQAGALGITFLSSVIAVFDIGASEMRFVQRDTARDETGDGESRTPGPSSSGNSSSGANSSVVIVAPPASSGLGDTNAGNRLLPLWGFRF